MNRLLHLLVLAGMFGSSCAWATLFTYADRPTFDLGAPGLPIEDFEETTAPAGSFVTETGPINSTTDGDDYNPSDILPGISIQDNPGPGGGGLLLGGTGLFAGLTKNIGTNSLPDSLDFIFGGVQAVGFDLVSASAPGTLQDATVTVSIYDTTDLLLDSFEVATSSSGSVFFGVISDADAIGRISLFSQPTGSEFADNIAFGAAGVPEPGTWMLLSAGLGLLGLRRLRMRV